MWNTIVGFFKRTLEKMGLVSHSYTSVPTPSGDVDLHYPDGNDGTVAIPLTWATIPSILQIQEGSTVSVNLATLYLTQAGSPNATITPVSGTLPTGWALSTAGLLTYNGTGIGSVSFRARATRLTKRSDSNFFTVQSIAHVASADTQAPTIPTGIRLVSQTANSATLACDAPADVPTALIPSDGMKEVRWFKGGVLDGSVSALTPGLLLRMSGVDIAAAATGREMTVGTHVAITPAQRASANGIPNAGTISDAGPACTNVKGFLLRKVWGTELELTPGLFTVSGIKKELADCASFTPKMKLWVMIVNRTFESPVDLTFASSVGGALSGTLSVAVPNGQYGVEFSNGQQRTPVTVTGGTHAAWSGALSAGSVLTGKAMKYSNNPMPTDMKTLADPFTQNGVGPGGGWQARRWDATVRDRFDKLCKGLYAGLKNDPNYDCLAGIGTQETSTGVPVAAAGYTFLGFADALMGEMDSIANAFPTKRQLFFLNYMAQTNNAQFNEVMGLSTTTGTVAGVPANREGVLQHALKQGVVMSFPDGVMVSGTITNRNYALIGAYHAAGGFTFGSIQGAEFTGANPGDVPVPRPMANVFGYMVGNTSYPDDNGANPLHVDGIVPDFHPAGGPAGDLSFVNDCVPLIKSATYNAPYGTITAPAGMAAGTVTQTGLDYSVLSFGSGIGATSDEWTAARVAVDGNFTLIAKLNAITGADTTGAIAGISIRDGTAITARAVHLVVTPSKIRSRARLTPGAAMTNVVDVAGQSWSTPKWLKITRAGNLFSYFWSADGKAWTAVGTVTVTMGTSVSAELFSAPVSVATSVTASFKQVNIQNLAEPTHTFAGLAAGTHNFTAVARDLALNDSAASPTLAVTI